MDLIKKIFSLLIFISITTLAFAVNTYAETTYKIEPAVNQGGLWHVVDDNRAYIYMRYSHIDDNGNEEYIVEETATEDDFIDPDGNGLGLDVIKNYTYLFGNAWDYELPGYFPNQQNDSMQAIDNPNPDIYTSFSFDVLYYADSSHTENSSLSEHFTVGAVDEIRVNFESNTPFSTTRYFMSIWADGVEIFNSNPYGQESDPSVYDPWVDYDYPRIQMYWSATEVVDTINPDDPVDPDNPTDVWEALPITDGSPKHPQYEWGYVEEWAFNPATKKLSFSVNYIDSIYQIEPFTVSAENTDFIEDATSILYYSDPFTNDRILYISFSEESTMMLTSTKPSEVTLWKGEALWNLTLNDVHVTTAVIAYNYVLDADVDGNIYSYFYMPNIDVDDLISVTSVLAYRYWDDGFLGIGTASPGDIQYQTVTATKGQTSTANPSWVETTYQTMYLTSAVTAALTLTVGAIPVYGWAVAGAFLLAGVIMNIADVQEWFAYDIDQIQYVIPDTELTNEINSYISDQSNDNTFDPSSDKLYKLHLATLETGHDDIEVMKDLSNVTQIVWETDGEIYVANEDFIVDTWTGPGTVVEPEEGLTVNEIILIIAGCIILVALWKGLDLSKKPGLLIIIIAGVIYILYTMGIINV